MNEILSAVVILLILDALMLMVALSARAKEAFEILFDVFVFGLGGVAVLGACYLLGYWIP